MYKEFIIIILILVFVIGLDFVTNNYVKATVNTMVDELNILKDAISQENIDDIQDRMSLIKEEWDKRYDILAYYIEHDELEKVVVQLSVIESNIKFDELGNAAEDIEEAIYLLKHIQEKEHFDFRSIF